MDQQKQYIAPLAEVRRCLDNVIYGWDKKTIYPKNDSILKSMGLSLSPLKYKSGKELTTHELNTGLKGIVDEEFQYLQDFYKLDDRLEIVKENMKKSISTYLSSAKDYLKILQKAAKAYSLHTKLLGLIGCGGGSVLVLIDNTARANIIKYWFNTTEQLIYSNSEESIGVMLFLTALTMVMPFAFMGDSPPELIGATPEYKDFIETRKRILSNAIKI